MKCIEVYSAVGVNTGKIRTNNEDNFYYNGLHLTAQNREIPTMFSEQRNDNIQIYAVCDGMGGEEFGETASLIAVETLGKYQEMLSTAPCHDFDKYVQMYMIEASNLINEQSKMLGGKRTGTTIAMVCVEGDKIRIYNVGDSRVYRLHKNKLVQVSEDHTPVARAIKLGTLKQKDAKTHPHRNKLTQYMGICAAEMVIKPHISEINAANNDVYLICSDGLTDMVEDKDIKKILKNKKSGPKEAVSELIEKALENGGRDNVTAMVLKISARRKWFK